MPIPLDINLPNLVKIPRGYQSLNPAGTGLANLALWHLQRIGNTGMLAAPPDGATTLPMGMPANPVNTSQRVWVNEPPGSVSFDEESGLTLPAAPNPGVYQPVLKMVVPQGYDGVINYISNTVTDPTFVDGSGELIWQITINNRPVRNYGNILVQKGTVAQGRKISPIRVFSGDVVAYTVQYTGGTVTGRTICSLSGYYYPSKGIS